MRALCLFASYFPEKTIPYYIGVYLLELKRHFEEVVLIGHQELSEESNDFLKMHQIIYQIQENVGFDFGKWYKAMQTYDVINYDRIALVNDSCILFKPLDEFINWSFTHPADVKGITESTAVAPHLQSYFLIINKKAIEPVLSYLQTHRQQQTIGEVIRVYEIGMCTHLLNRGFSLAAYLSNNGYVGEFSPYYHCINFHIASGIPLIKKKILYFSYRQDELLTLARMNFNISPYYYIHLIKKHNKELLIDFNKVIVSSRYSANILQRWRYQFTRISILMLRPLYKMINRLFSLIKQ